MHESACHGAYECLQVMVLERAESRRVFGVLEVKDGLDRIGKKKLDNGKNCMHWKVPLDGCTSWTLVRVLDCWLNDCIIAVHVLHVPQVQDNHSLLVLNPACKQCEHQLLSIWLGLGRQGNRKG